jgi:hypothetical protein
MIHQHLKMNDREVHLTDAPAEMPEKRLGLFAIVKALAACGRWENRR